MNKDPSDGSVLHGAFIASLSMHARHVSWTCQFEARVAVTFYRCSFIAATGSGRNRPSRRAGRVVSRVEGVRRRPCFCRSHRPVGRRLELALQLRRGVRERREEHRPSRCELRSYAGSSPFWQRPDIIRGGQQVWRSGQGDVHSSDVVALHSQEGIRRRLVGGLRPPSEQ